MKINDIKERLTNFFKNSRIEVFDSRGTGDYYSIIVISDRFNNISLVDRHRMIYNLFKDEISAEIHAMEIKTYTHKEWKDKNISN